MYYVHGDFSEQPLSEVVNSAQVAIHDSSYRVRLANLHDEVDRGYQHVAGLIARRDASDVAGDRETLDREIQQTFEWIGQCESQAAALMREAFDSGGSLRRLDAGIEALRQAKENLARSEGTSTSHEGA